MPPKCPCINAKSYPSLADEAKNLIYLKSDNNQIPKKNNLSVIVGLPWNTEEICISLCAAVCSEKDKILKVDVSNDISDVEKTVLLWETPLPLALEIKTLKEKGLNEYTPSNLQHTDYAPVDDPMPLDKKPGSIDQPSKQYCSEILERSEFKNLVDQYVYQKKRLITSGFRLRYLQWCNVFYGDQLALEKRVLAMYSKTQVGQEKPRSYVGRIGRAHAQVSGFSLVMSVFGIPNSKNTISTCSSTDGIWDLAEGLVDDHKPVIGQNHEQLPISILPNTYLTQKSMERSDFTPGIVELFLNGDLKGNEFRLFSLAVSSENVSPINILGNPSLQSARRSDIEARASELNVNIDPILNQFQNTDREALFAKYRALNMNPQENIMEHYLNEYYYAFKAYKQGLKITPQDSTKNDLMVISSNNWNQYLVKWPKSETYDGWMPLKPYRKIENEFARRLFGNSGESFNFEQRLISKKNLGKIDISLSAVPSDWSLCNIEDEQYDTWKVSLETIQKAFQMTCKDDSIAVKLYKAPEKTGCKLFDNQDSIGIGNSGWDVCQINNNYCFVTSKLEPDKLRMEHFNETIQRFQLHLKERSNSITLDDEVIKSAYDSLAFEIPYYRMPSWFDQHIVMNYQELEEQCLRGELSQVYELLKKGVSELLEGKGNAPPGSPGSRCMGMRMVQTEEQELEHFRPSKMRKAMDIWYEHTPSMAADEPLVQTPGPDPKTYYANLFLHHDQNTMMEKGGGRGRERRMKRCNIDNFFGSRIGLSSHFFMLAKTDGRVRLNDEKGQSLERFIKQYSGNGDIEKELYLHDALLVDGLPTTLRIHPFHLAAMAAVETALNNFEPKY